MPELPEVTTFINVLSKQVLNKEIIDVIVNNVKIIKNSTPDIFKTFFLHESFTRIDRKGKYLIFHLTNDKVLVVHLRMEGKLIFHHQDDPLLNNHNLVTFRFKNKQEMRYYDTRMFGTMDIYLHQDPFKANSGLNKIGLEPFDPNFNLSYLKNAFNKHVNTNLKTILLDQTVIAGIGNIYADEILFACKLNPLDTPKKLSDQDYLNIIENTKRILQEAIACQGTTVASYSFDSSFHAGTYQDKLKVHTRQNKPCYVCGSIIKKTTVNGRGTYYCPTCQGEIIPKQTKK